MSDNIYGISSRKFNGIIGIAAVVASALVCALALALGVASVARRTGERDCVIECKVAGQGLSGAVHSKLGCVCFQRESENP